MRTAEEISVMKFVSVTTVRSDTRSIVRKLRAPHDDDTDRLPRRRAMISTAESTSGQFSAASNSESVRTASGVRVVADFLTATHARSNVHRVRAVR